MLRAIATFLLGILLTFSLSFALFGFAAEELLEPPTWQRALDEGNLSLPGLADADIDAAVGQVLSYLRGETAELSLIDEETLRLRAEEMVADLPPCDPGSQEVCLPPGAAPEAIVAIVLERAQAGIAETEEEIATALEPGRRVVAYANLATRAALALAAVCAAMIVFLQWPLKGVRRVEADVLLVGLGAIASSLAIGRQVPRMLPAELADFHGIIISLVRAMLDTLFIYGVAAATVAGAMLVITVIVSMVASRTKN